ncbi:MAG TPA: RT0821/Lpp0805 family surface protein [Rickettsiales bacterium]|nr:RT0821/Lpp0805 family surface protein [Rickettsiales bacterium]
MKHKKIISCLLVASILGGCTEPNGAPGRGVENGGALSKTDVGTAAGVVAGGVLGSTIGGGTGQVIATIGGGLLGGILGNSIGKSLDNADRAEYDRAAQHAMETGHRQSWKNADSGHRGYITPRKSYHADDGSLCREYTQTIYIEGKKHRASGTACRTEDGTWKIAD